MIIVTGGAGFIGSNIVKKLNHDGYDNIIVVDDLTDGHKFVNLVGCKFVDYMDMGDFIEIFATNNEFQKAIDVVFHQGACSTTTEWDGKYMMDNNYKYSRILLHTCIDKQIPFIYASSAAVYGLSNNFAENPANESPLNVYGFSKLMFDNYVRTITADIDSQVVGLRYFNVYGPNEQHKGSMASVVHHFRKQLKTEDKIKLFAGSLGYTDGEQRRDFVYVDDIVDVNLWFWQNPQISGIYNVGTGTSQSFNQLAREVLGWYKRGSIEYIPFPEELLGAYQGFTEADIKALRAAGYTKKFTSIKTGVAKYLNHVEK